MIRFKCNHKRSIAEEHIDKSLLSIGETIVWSTNEIRYVGSWLVFLNKSKYKEKQVVQL